LGHPLIGDDVYGPGFRTKTALLTDEARIAVEGLGRQALHSHFLAVDHPATGEYLEFRVPLPDDLEALRKALVKPASGAGLRDVKKNKKNKG